MSKTIGKRLLLAELQSKFFFGQKELCSHAHENKLRKDCADSKTNARMYSNEFNFWRNFLWGFVKSLAKANEYHIESLNTN